MDSNVSTVSQSEPNASQLSSQTSSGRFSVKASPEHESDTSAEETGTAVEGGVGADGVAAAAKSQQPKKRRLERGEEQVDTSLIGDLSQWSLEIEELERRLQSGDVGGKDAEEAPCGDESIVSMEEQNRIHEEWEAQMKALGVFGGTVLKGFEDRRQVPLPNELPLP